MILTCERVLWTTSNNFFFVCVVCCRVYTEAKLNSSGFRSEKNANDKYYEIFKNVTGTVPISEKLSWDSPVKLSDEDDLAQVYTTQLDSDAIFVQMTVIDFTPRNVTLFL